MKKNKNSRRSAATRAWPPRRRWWRSRSQRRCWPRGVRLRRQQRGRMRLYSDLITSERVNYLNLQLEVLWFRFFWNAMMSHNKYPIFDSIAVTRIDSSAVKIWIIAGIGIGIGIINFWKMMKIRFRNRFLSRNHYTSIYNPKSNHSYLHSLHLRALALELHVLGVVQLAQLVNPAEYSHV